jgi:HEAT repeat protein
MPAVVTTLDLKRMVVKEDVEGLCKILNNGAIPIEFRTTTARFLGNMRDTERAVDALILASKDPNPALRAEAIDALGKKDNSRAKERLGGILNDQSEDKALQLQAGKALERARNRMEREFGAQVKQPIPTAQENRTERIVRKEVTSKDMEDMHRQGDTEGLTNQLLNNPDPKFRWEAAYQLGRGKGKGSKARDSKTVEPLLEALEKETDDRVRCEIIASLEKHGDKKAKGALTPIALNAQDEAQFRALCALEKIADEELVGAIIPRFHQYNEETQKKMVEILGKAGSARAERFLAGLIDSRNDTARDADFVDTVNKAIRHSREVRRERDSGSET